MEQPSPAGIAWRRLGTSSKRGQPILSLDETVEILAQGGNVPEGYDFPFRGCLVHYEAPEIVRRVLATGEAEPTEEADLYALGAGR